MSGLRHEHLAERGERIVDAAAEAGIEARIVGGAGIWRSLPAARRPAYERVRPVPRDVDLLLAPKSGRPAMDLFGSFGFQGDERLNAWRGDQRQKWYAEAGGGEHIEIDVFIGRPPLCHPIDFSSRLGLAGPAMPATDLLLQKIQIVEINRKDLIDCAFLMLDRELDGGPEHPEAISSARIEGLVARDWGFFHTASTNLARVADEARSFLGGPDAEAVASVSARLLEAMETVPKSRRWRMRAKVGTRAQWYEEVEEVDR